MTLKNLKAVITDKL